MRTEVGGSALLLVAVALAALLAARPLVQARDDDAGDGLATVSIPRPRSVSLARVACFYACSSLLTLALVIERPGAPQLYDALVGRLALVAYDHPLETVVYAGHVSAALRLVVVANILALSVVVRASPLRRVAMCTNAVLFCAIALPLDALGAATAAAARMPSEGASLLGSFLVLVVAVLVMLRTLATTYALPRPTMLPDLRVRHRSESLLLAGAVLLASVIVLAAVDLCDTVLAPRHPDAFLVVFVGFALVFEVLLALLLLATRPIRPPAATGERPPISTITPAFNEETTIARTLSSLDAAAGRYGAEVTVVLADDGSTDRTVQVASAVMEEFRHATGLLVRTSHGGKAAALNTALSVVTTEVVVRVDADVEVAEDAFVRLPDWFANPSVGMVGALALPAGRARSWYAKGRLFECLIGFGFARVALQRVDAINCIPGTFTAFRRAPASFAGGFVSGMNGEDSDLTMALGRLGYQVVVDTRIRIYEDVPDSLRAFREQRVRWNRAGVHVLSRYSPLLSGGGSPRTWFFYLRAATVRVTAALRPLVFLTGVELSLANPATRSIAARVLVFYLVAALPTLSVASVLAVRHGYWRQLAWLPIWLPFTFLRRIVALEALLTMPTRTVRLSAAALFPPRAMPPRLDEAVLAELAAPGSHASAGAP